MDDQALAATVPVADAGAVSAGLEVVAESSLAFFLFFKRPRGITISLER